MAAENTSELQQTHIEELKKTFIEVNCINNKHRREKVFCSCYFWMFVSSLFSGRVKKTCVYVGLHEQLLEKRVVWIFHYFISLLYFRNKFSFLCVDIDSLVNCEFILKNSNLTNWQCFHLFLWPQFRSSFNINDFKT